jgi:hypothetical protein
MKANNKISRDKMRKQQARLAKKNALRKKVDLVRNIKRNNLSKKTEADQELLMLNTKEFLAHLDGSEE